jgi:hypothetical protein
LSESETHQRPFGAALALMGIRLPFNPSYFFVGTKAVAFVGLKNARFDFKLIVHDPGWRAKARRTIFAKELSCERSHA